MGRLELELENSTPLLVGWYRPELADPQGIRPTEVKGLWRWWARAFIGGVLYDEGLLRGSSYGSVLLKPTRDEVKLIAKLVGEELGLGLAVSGESRASKFVVYVESLSKIDSENTADRWAREWQRKGLRPGSKFRLYVEWDDKRRPEYLETALRILLITLLLTGIGKKSRRGSGSLDLIQIKTQEELMSEKWRDLKSLLEKIYNDCLKLVKSSDSVRKYAVRRSHLPEGAQLPPFPVVSRKLVFGVPITNIKVINSLAPSMFAEVRKLFSECATGLRRNLADWFLGLPRAGYSTGVSRRASPVLLAFHTDRNLFGKGAFVTVLLSSDWPKVIGQRKNTQIKMNDKAIIDAYTKFDQEFSAHLIRLDIGQSVKKVWP